MRDRRNPEFAQQPNGGSVALCGARTRRGTACRGKAIAATGRCRMHGGHSLAGPAHGNWRGGVSTSRYNGPPLICEAIAASLTDPKMLDLDQEIGLVLARTRQELARLNAVIDPNQFAEVTDALLAAMKSSDSDAIRVAVHRLSDLRTTTFDDERTWNRILRLIERRRRLVESQRRRIQELNLTLTRQQVLTFANALLEAITRHVRDVDTLEAITNEFRSVLAGRSGEAVH